LARHWFEIDPQLNPEKCEPFGIRILEAMAMGCIPFVVSNGGPIEFVHEGNTGFQFATLEELTMKTRSILRDPARAAEVSARAIQEAHKFAAPMFANQWSKIVGGQLARAQDENKPLCQGS
jgi:glycosyltransferase involved in cell wall biosynthesis